MKEGINYLEAVQFFLITMATAVVSAMMLAGIVLLLSAPAHAEQFAKSAQNLHENITVTIKK